MIIWKYITPYRVVIIVIAVANSVTVCKEGVIGNCCCCMLNGMDPKILKYCFHHTKYPNKLSFCFNSV